MRRSVVRRYRCAVSLSPQRLHRIENALEVRPPGWVARQPLCGGEEASRLVGFRGQTIERLAEFEQARSAAQDEVAAFGLLQTRWAGALAVQLASRSGARQLGFHQGDFTAQPFIQVHVRIPWRESEILRRRGNPVKFVRDLVAGQTKVTNLAVCYLR
jgi:hypothetical protein